MATMKAIVVKKFGSTDGLELAEVPKPTPLPRDLLVRLKAVSINPVDTKVRKNTHAAHSDANAAPKDTLILGYDGVGIVEAVGSEVKFYKAGDEVFFAGSRIRNGTNAEFIVVDERIVGRKPKNFTWEQAAAIPLTGLTAWEGLAEQLAIEPNSDNSNKTLLVVAGAGGVGSIVIPLAKKVFNLKVIATASRPETVEYVKKIGADFVIDHTKPDLLEQLKALGYPTGVNYVFNCGEASQNFDQVAPTVTHFGKIVFITGGPSNANLNQFFPKRVTLAWEMMFARSMTGIDIEKQHEILEKLADLTERGVIPDRVTKVFSLKNEIAQAHQLQESGKAIGKIVLTVDL